ncbi:hypothetical protein MicloDRAFT_00006070 [Microvirga lotononidis]|uniref:Uncharacterized protein n=1 Tax=Microvirga lotononidis TaxID=864069 RepID=I4Z3B2_9HYPH|nr:hypothetical protein MicloDRAFT_00006070 [Microvirga lotononidis]
MLIEGHICKSIAPNSTRLALRPVIGTRACVPLSAQVARSGGNSRSSVQSRHSSRSLLCQPAFRRRVIPPYMGRSVKRWQAVCRIEVRV